MRDGIRYRRFQEMRRAAGRMVMIYEKFLKDGYSTEDALLYAFQRIHRDRKKNSVAVSAVRLEEMLADALVVAEQTLWEMYRKGPLSTYGRRIETIEEVANETEPDRFMNMLARPRPDNGLKARLIWEDGWRNFVIAMQALVIEVNCPHRRLSRGVRIINEMEQSRLFDNGLQELWFVAVLNPDDCDRVLGTKADANMQPHVYTYSNRITWEAKCEALRAEFPELPLYVEERFECHTLSDERYRYLARRVPRRKRLASILGKLERRGHVGDIIAWTYMLVGVQPVHGGPIRSANRDDAKRFEQLVRLRLWTGQLQMIADVDPPNPSRSTRYWDSKTIGYFVQEVGDRRVADSAEQIVIPLADYVNVECSTGSEGRGPYEGDRALRLAPIWFGHRNINWRDPEVIETLRSRWSARPALTFWKG